MNLIIKEILSLIKDCESNKGLREAEKIRAERECYRKIKELLYVVEGEKCER